MFELVEQNSMLLSFCRVYEPTQGVCVQSYTQSEGDIYMYTYLHHKYKKLALTTPSEILLLEVRIYRYNLYPISIIPYDFTVERLHTIT